MLTITKNRRLSWLANTMFDAIKGNFVRDICENKCCWSCKYLHNYALVVEKNSFVAIKGPTCNNYKPLLFFAWEQYGRTVQHRASSILGETWSFRSSSSEMNIFFSSKLSRIDLINFISFLWIQLGSHVFTLLTSKGPFSLNKFLRNWLNTWSFKYAFGILVLRVRVKSVIILNYDSDFWQVLAMK